jgi:hypothetical protein
MTFSGLSFTQQSASEGIEVDEIRAVMSPEQLRSFREGKFLTWATFMTDWARLDGMIADAVRRGAYLNPTLHYEWGGMSRSALQRELEVQPSSARTSIAKR